MTLILLTLAWLIRFEFNKRLDQRVLGLRDELWRELQQRIHDDRLVDDSNRDVE